MCYPDHIRHQLHFRRRVRDGERLLGTFLKFLTGQPTEILGALGWDFVIIDQEHAPFDHRITDEAVLAARAAGLAAIVRTPDASPQFILKALDIGANGIIIPHVNDAGQAAAIVRAARYRDGSRGFALATRAANWGLVAAKDYMTAADDYVTVIAQIEDREGLEKVEEITAVDGLDGVFIGRGDLSVALGETDMSSPVMVAATNRIVSAAQKNGVAVSAYAGTIEEVRVLEKAGVRGFLYASDQTFFMRAARQAKSEFDALAERSA